MWPYFELDALLVDMESGCVSFLHMVKQEGQKFCSVNGTLSNFLLVINRDGNNLATRVVAAERDPDSIAVARDLVEVFPNADAVKQLGGIHPYAQASTYFLVFRCLFIYVYHHTAILGTVMVYRERSTKAANATTDDGDVKRELLARHVVWKESCCARLISNET